MGFAFLLEGGQQKTDQAQRPIKKGLIAGVLLNIVNDTRVLTGQAAQVRVPIRVLQKPAIQHHIGPMWQATFV